MSERILTLFGEELLPEPVAPPPRKKAEKKQDDKKTTTETAEPEQPVAVVVEPIPAQPAATPETIAESQETETAAADPLPDDWDGDKQYYTIGEVATLLQVKTSNVRFWTNEFQLKVRTTRKGDRLYTPAQVKELKAIYHLVKQRGFTLNGAKTKLKTQNKKDVETVDLKQMLTGLRNKLVAIKNQLK